MIDGLILLALLAFGITLLTMRVRRRMGLAATGRIWLSVITTLVVGGLVLWVASKH